MAEMKIIHRTSNESYASHRRVVPELPPLLHIKEHDKTVTASLPQLFASPVREGGFVDMRTEAASLIDFLHDMGRLNLEDEIYVKPACDALKLTNTKSLCIYSVQVISAGSEIALVGAVEGGDGYDDMRYSGAPFLNNLKEFAKDPVLKTKVGHVSVKIRVGGDMVNMLEMLGLAKASSNHPCPACILPRNQFWKATVDEGLLRSCNNHELGRTRASIWNEAIKPPKDRCFSVKNAPIIPVPRDTNALIIDAVVFCELHMRVRLCGNLLLLVVVVVVVVVVSVVIVSSIITVVILSSFDILLTLSVMEY